MRLESALYTSQNGLEVHGAAISVVGDNLANVNTVGFKGSRAEFASMVSDGLEGGTSDTVPMPGNGVKVSSIREVKELGPIEPTGRALDVAIDGNGYFVVGSTTESFYTRAGNFTLDASGNLVTADGRNVLGYTVTNGTTSTSLGTINITNFNANPSATSSATLKGNLDASASITTAASNPASFKELNSAASFITTADVIDSLGETHTATLAFFKTAANTYTVQAYMDGGEISGGTEGTPSLISSGQLTFGSDGTIPDASKSQATLTLSPSYANG
ncbi:MAG: flagellar hook-basal body complex protein, partial [Candidatus Dadabacteria bacterium]